MTREHIETKITSELASQFDQYMKKYQWLYQNLAQKAQKHLDGNSTNPILVDLGAGPGLFSVAVHTILPSVSVIGVDTSLEMLQCATQNTNAAGITCFLPIQAKAEHLPFKDGSVDMVVSRFSLLYWDTPLEGCQEIYRILRPGGHVIIEALNGAYAHWRLWLMLHHMRLRGADTSVIKYQKEAYAKAYTTLEVQQFLVHSQFTIIEKEGKKTDWQFLLVARK